jgi:SAM-dependent methyltransferase
MPSAAPVTDGPASFNTDAWSTGDYVRDYSETDIRVVEAILVARHRDALRGPVLELGCGAGRLTRVLAALSDEVRAIDVSKRMVAACRRNVPAAHVDVGDLRDLSGLASASTGAVVGSANVLDILGDAERTAALTEIQRILRPDGLLLFSTHNRAHLALMRRPTRLLDPLSGPFPRSLARAVWNARRLPMRVGNRRRTRLYERSEPGYAIVNDGAHDNRLVMYYIGRDAQQRQLADAGLELVDCLDIEGHEVPAGQDAPTSSALHYAARRTG